MRTIIADEIYGKMVVKNADTKFFQTLQGHTEDCLKVLKKYIEVYQDELRGFCLDFNIRFDQYIRALFWTVYFHDIGKITSEFQNNIKEGKTSSSYPHPLYSFHITSCFSNNILLQIPVERLAILGHHTQLYTDIYDMQLNIRIKSPTYLQTEIYSFIEQSYIYYQKLGFNKYFKMERYENIKLSRFSRTQIDREIRNYARGRYEDNKIKIKAIFSMLLSILKTCDWYASFNFSKKVKNGEISSNYCGSILNETEQLFPVLKVNNLNEIILQGMNPYSFQQSIYDECPRNCILYAPCGRGKTEAALFWGLRAMKKYNKSKIIIALPTQITCNAMWERICEIFGTSDSPKGKKISGTKYVGLFHGKSYIKIKEVLKPESNEDDTDQLNMEIQRGNVFFKPITITTIDHLLYSSVHGFSQADFAFGNLIKSVIIFDEVHYYEKNTLEHIITFLKLLNELRVPHLLMSGTLPKFFEETLNSKIGLYEKIEDEEGLSFTPFIVEWKKEFLVKKNNGNTNNMFNEQSNIHINENIIKEIILNLNSGLKQAIILNTIDKAKCVYNELKNYLSNMGKGNEKILLYHSEFTFQDRLKKEQQIKKWNKEDGAFILVGTQAIEISLDFSVDVMYTEIAPPDALGQRAGRLHRKGRHYISEKTEHKLYIFDVEDNLPYETNLLERTKTHITNFMGMWSYKKIKDFCDLIYKDELQFPTTLFFSRDSFFDRGTLFGPPYYKITSKDEKGISLKLREEKLMKFNVIPLSKWEEKGERALSAEYMVSVYFWRYKKYPECFDIVVKDSEEYILCTYPYNSDLGFDWKRKCERNYSNII